MSLPVETFNLGKSYGTVHAVRELSLQVREGEIYAFLGLNGAGKTTTIRMLLGMIRPSTGYASVLGTRVRLGSSEPWSRVGYMVETPRAYPELTVRENLEVARRLHPGTPARAVSDIVERLGLAAYVDWRAGDLSLGNAQRLGIAKALLHGPRLLLLDEPANGLDPAGIVEIRNLLLALTRNEGVTVFMSSHILAEVARLAARVGIIHDGRLLRELDMDQLERERRKRLVVRVREPVAALAALAGAGKQAQSLPDGSLALLDDNSMARPDDVNRLLVNAGAAPMQLGLEEEELERYFLRLVGQQEAIA